MSIDTRLALPPAVITDLYRALEEALMLGHPDLGLATKFSAYPDRLVIHLINDRTLTLVREGPADE